MAVSLVVGFAVLVVAVWLAWRVVSPPLRIAERLKKQGIRGSNFVPLVGTMPLIARLVEESTEPFLGIWRYLRQQHGDLHYYFFGPSCNLMIRDASLVREITVTHANSFEKPPIYMRILGPLVGATSLIIAGAKSHRRIRRIAGAAFQFPVLQRFAPLMAELAVRFADTLLPAAAGPGDGGWHEVDVSSSLSSVTLSIICRTALASEGDGGASAISDRIGSIFSRGMTFLMDSAMNMTLFIPGWLRVSMGS